MEERDLNQLREHGWCVVLDVLSRDECEDYVGIFDTEIHRIASKCDGSYRHNHVIPPQRRADGTSDEAISRASNISALNPIRGMLIQHWGVGHLQPVWDIRERTAPIFAHIWNCEAHDLISSFDGISYGLPQEQVGGLLAPRDSVPELHFDQYVKSDVPRYYQGLMNLMDSSGEDATFAMMPGSRQLFDTLVGGAKQWFPFVDSRTTFDVMSLDDAVVDNHSVYGYNYDYVNAMNHAVRIALPAGCVLFWDSRLAHAGVKPLKGRPVVRSRCVVYSCMIPRSRATPAQLKKKIKAFVERRMTTHEPERVKLFPKHPRLYDGQTDAVFKKLDEASYPDVELTPLMRRLVGY